MSECNQCKKSPEEEIVECFRCGEPTCTECGEDYSSNHVLSSDDVYQCYSCEEKFPSGICETCETAKVPCDELKEKFVECQCECWHCPDCAADVVFECAGCGKPTCEDGSDPDGEHPEYCTDCENEFTFCYSCKKGVENPKEWKACVECSEDFCVECADTVKENEDGNRVCGECRG